ncbi:MAG TPA: sugar transferase [Candidatus Saccharimonadales bacterium]|nr:sugar transferase [Candidatus Saccharimonadales bacterium]
MALAEEAHLASSLSSEAAWGEPAEIDLVGEARARTAPASTSDAARAADPLPWPVILAITTFAVDVVAVIGGYLLSKGLLDMLFPVKSGQLFRGPVFATVAIWPVVFAVYGLYDLRRPTHATAEFRRLFNAAVMSVLLVVLVTFVAETDPRRELIPALLVVCFVTVTTGRLISRRLTHVLNARAVTSQLTLVAGTNDEARALARTLMRRPWMGYRVCGFVEVTRSGLEVMDGIPVLGTVDDIAQISSAHSVRAVIIAGSAAGGATLQNIDSALPADVNVRVSPGLPNLGAARVILEPIDGMALFSLRRHRFSRRQRVQKRALDLFVTSIALVVAAPLMLGIALLIRMTSPGPVLFRQRRVGAQERPFTILKFRTMVVNADAQRDGLVANNEADGLLFKMRRDPRVTKVGRLLRRTSLDELPQLFNVLRGEMSLVGPRPALPDEATRYVEAQRARLRVKPGVTGLWQVNGRHDLAFEDYVRYDLFYVENWSLTMDLYILAKTVPALLTARGSY